MNGKAPSSQLFLKLVRKEEPLKSIAMDKFETSSILTNFANSACCVYFDLYFHFLSSDDSVFVPTARNGDGGWWSEEDLRNRTKKTPAVSIYKSLRF